MSDTVKVIIEIPKEVKADIDNGVIRRNIDKIYLALANGIPLDSNSERAEVQAYFHGQAYGWEQGRKALIKDVKAEITALRYGSDTYKYAIDDVIDILDNIGKAESEDKNNC